jgi:hypothetical protein
MRAWQMRMRSCCGEVHERATPVKHGGEKWVWRERDVEQEQRYVGAGD